MNSMLKEERQQLILESLQSSQKVTVAELSERFGTSRVTIRRDLHELAESGKVRRARRGALIPIPAPAEAPVIRRLAQQQPFKERIAHAAASLIQDGESVFIGSGSTMTYLARQLGTRQFLTIITNALNIATDLSAAEGTLTIVMTGGILRNMELSLLGYLSELTLPELHVDKVFMGAQALSLQAGWTTDHLPEVSSTRKFIKMSSQLIVLADHTKLNRVAAAFIAPLTRITTLVTDDQADPQFVAGLREMGLQVIMA